VARVPGVEAVGGIKHLPFKGTGEKWPVYPAGDPPQRGTAPEVMALHVTAGYFEAMGIPLVAGRLFDDRSPTGGVSEVMINHALARRFFPGRSAVGERIAFDSANSVAVIGVVGDVRQGALDREAEPAIYVNGLQNLRVRVTIVARTKGDAGAMASAIRAAIWDVNPSQTITTVSTLDDVLGETVARPRLLTMLLLMFAGFGLLLGALGLYGVLAFAVAQRRQEIGVRMALGASPGDVVRLVVTQAAGLVALGLVLGLAGAAALTRVMRAVLFEVSTTDPASFAVAVAVLALAALAACVAPAWRALRTDPMVALRQE
jgi:putative ABC transport system permease protein